MCEVTGYSFEEIIGKTPRELQGLRTNKEITDKLKKIILENKVFECETVNYKKDKTPYRVKIVICPLFNNFGNLINYVGIHEVIEILEKEETH